MSFFADLLGNAALTGEKIVGDKIEQRQRLELEDRQNALAIERQKAIDANRVAAEEKKLQERQERTSKQLQQAEAQAPEISRARQLLEAQGRAPSVDANVLDVIKSRLSPDELKKYYGVKDDAVSRIDDQLTAARRGGMYDAEAALKASRAETVAALKEEWKQKVEETKIDQQDRKIDQQDRRLDIMASRGSASGTDKENSVQSTYENDKGYKVNVMRSGKHVVATDPDGNPITTEKFEKRVDAMAKDLMKNNRRVYGAMPLDEVRAKVRSTLRQTDSAPAKTTAPADKPAEKTAAPAKKATTSNW